MSGQMRRQREFREGKPGNPSVRPPRKVRVGSLRTNEIWSHWLMLLRQMARAW
jgi:hypothetical protein